jgi:hypothetical protein
MTILVVQAAAAWFGAGVLWTMQVLNYPLLGLIGADQVPAYETAHNRRFAVVVLPPTAVVLVTSVLLLFRGAFVVAVVALSLLVVIVVVTVVFGAPAHALLAQRFDAPVHRRLVRTNWIRTVAWTALAVTTCAALV